MNRSQGSKASILSHFSIQGVTVCFRDLPRNIQVGDFGRSLELSRFGQRAKEPKVTRLPDVCPQLFAIL